MPVLLEMGSRSRGGAAAVDPLQRWHKDLGVGFVGEEEE